MSRCRTIRRPPRLRPLRRVLEVAVGAAALLAVLASGATYATASTPSDQGSPPPSKTEPAFASGGACQAPQIIATLDGEPITLEDVEPEIAFQIYRRQVDIYALLKQAAEDLAEKRMVQAEARRRGVSVDALLQGADDASATPATGKDIDDYLAKHPEAAGQPNARERIGFYLTEKRKIERRLHRLADIRAQSDFQLRIKPPVQPRVRVPLEGAPARGPADAPVTLVHFASFSSPRSARSVEYLRRLEREFPGKLRWVHRSFPADHDEIGLAAAQLAVEADRAGKFWEAHDRLFALEGSVGADDLQRIASDLGLAPIEPGQTPYLDAVKADIDVAVHIGLTDAPVVFVNGLYFSTTFPYEKLHDLVAGELGSPVDVQSNLAR